MNKQLLHSLRRMGKIPDWAWYQINGNSAQENYVEQRQKFLDDFYSSEEDETNIVFTFEFKEKK